VKGTAADGVMQEQLWRPYPTRGRQEGSNTADHHLDNYQVYLVDELQFRWGRSKDHLRQAMFTNADTMTIYLTGVLVYKRVRQSCPNKQPLCLNYWQDYPTEG
jgi:hypothetical protein